MGVVWPRRTNAAQGPAVKAGRALHWAAVAISLSLLSIAGAATLLAIYQAATNAGEWANDYWFNPHWIPTAAWGVVFALGAVLTYFAGRLLRLVLSRE